MKQQGKEFIEIHRFNNTAVKPLEEAISRQLISLKAKYAAVDLLADIFLQYCELCDKAELEENYEMMYDYVSIKFALKDMLFICLSDTFLED